MSTDCSGGERGARLDPRQVQTEASRFLGDLNKIYPDALAAATRDVRGNFLARLEHWPSNPVAGNEQKPVGNLVFAGEHTSLFYEWQGFMEGRGGVGPACSRRGPAGALDANPCSVGAEGR